MSTLSYATQRKIKIIEEKLGSNWRELHPDASIDRVYNLINGDTRKNLFCKVNPDVKAKLDEMVVEYDVEMAHLVEQMIESAYENFQEQRTQFADKLAGQFA